MSKKKVSTNKSKTRKPNTKETSPKKTAKPKPEPQGGPLKGWAAIAGFLKIPGATVQRWAKAGMPVKREGRFTTANPDELLAWLGREAHMSRPAQIATNEADLAAGLKESIAAAKKRAKE